MQEMSWFFKENKTSDVPMRSVWHAGNAKLRGIVIQHAARQKKEKVQKYKELEIKLFQLEQQSKQNSSIETLVDNMKLVQNQINL